MYGGQFKDDPGGLQLKHDRRGLLSMANMGPDVRLGLSAEVVCSARLTGALACRPTRATSASWWRLHPT